VVTPLNNNRSNGYIVDETGNVSVYDLDFASFLLMHGVVIAESYRDGREFLFKFYDPEGNVAKLAITYANSESAKFADCVRRIKKITIPRSFNGR